MKMGIQTIVDWIPALAGMTICEQRSRNKFGMTL